MRTIAAMEHVNVTVPDQALAALFYISAMGFTRDPYLDFDDWNMWINVGREQFHTPKGPPQVFRGEIGIRVPCLEGLEHRLRRLEARFQGSEFGFAKSTNDDAEIRVTCPWGNRFVCREASPGEYPMAIERLTIPVPQASLGALSSTYESLLGTEVLRRERSVQVPTGASQSLSFVASDSTSPPYDGHHIAIYIDNHAEARQRVIDAGLLSAEREPHEFRFIEFREAQTGQVVWELEHEVRSIEHPMFGRPLVNRNPANTLFNYEPRRETLASLAICG